MQLRLTIHAELNSVTGYGLHLQKLVEGFQKRGFHISIRPIRVVEPCGVRLPLKLKSLVVNSPQPEEWELMLCPPHHVPAPNKKVIYYTMWETTELTGLSVALLNRAKAVVVPSRWCKENFVASGVTVPIFVVPLGIDPEVFTHKPVILGPGRVFGTAGRLAHGQVRKGVRGVIRAFKEAFRHGEDVQLRVKLHPDCDCPEEADRRITFTRAHLSERQVAEWIHGIDCFVSGATGEGWGLWQHQALACGRWLIACPYGGLTEFFRSGGLVDYHEMPARDGFTCGKWAEPDWYSMIQAMRFFVGISGGTVLENELARSFTWERSMDRLLRVFNKLSFPMPLHIPETDDNDPPRNVVIEREVAPDWKGQLVLNRWSGGRIAVSTEKDKVVYNPTLIATDEGYLVFARAGHLDNMGNVNGNRIEMWAMNEEMRILRVKTLDLGTGEQEDPRACWSGDSDRILLSFASIDEETLRSNGQKAAVQKLALVTTNGDVNWIVQPAIGNNGTMRPPEGYANPGEKNWVWFNHDGIWHCVYNIEPHTVYRVGIGGVRDPSYLTTPNLSFWTWGRPSASTPPRLIGNEYWSFFHSRMPWKMDRLRYFCGVYAFEARPPFRITRMSYSPILVGSPNDLKSPSPSPHCLIYPGGAVFDGDMWRVVAGVNDEYCIWVDIPHADLEKGMRPVL